MRVMRILRNLFKKSSIKVHKARMLSVFFAVEALLNGGRLNCAGLGRSARSKVKPKHNIKRIDRLLGNSKLHSELRLFFKAIAKAAIGRSVQPIILVDWTKVDYGKFSALTAAVPVDGRSLPILWQVYEDSKWGSPDARPLQADTGDRCRLSQSMVRLGDEAWLGLGRKELIFQSQAVCWLQLADRQRSSLYGDPPAQGSGCM